MTEVLITGIKIPKTGVQAFTIDSEGNVSLGIFENNTVGKAKELPSHGRLVDADANREDFMNTVYYELCSDGDNYRANRIIDEYDNAPTIIEASEERE